MTAPAPAGTAPDYKLGAVLPHVRRAAETFGPQFGITTILGWRATARDMMGHPAGLALDYMCGLSTGKALNSALHANAGAIGLKYTIHDQTYFPVGGEPEPMEDRGNPTQNHKDHVHAQFKASGGDGSVLKSGPMTVDGGDGLLSGWQSDATSLGLKIMAAGCVAALIVVGLKTTVTNGSQA